MGNARFDEFSGLGENLSEQELIARIRAAQAQDTAPKKPAAHETEKRDLFKEADAISADAARRTENDRKFGLRPGKSSNAKEAFTTQLAESAVDTMVSPVTVPARIANAVGFKNTIADDITGARLVENVNELRDGRVPAQTRRDREADRTEHEFATTAGQLTGEAFGGAVPGIGLAGMEASAAFRALPQAVQAARRTRGQRGFLTTDGRPVETMILGGARDFDGDEVVREAQRVFGVDIRDDETRNLLAHRLTGHEDRLEVTSAPAFETKGGGVVIDTRVKTKGAPNSTKSRGLIQRTFNRGLDGELVVKHDFLFLPDDLQGQGVGPSLIRDQISTYEQLGVKRIELTAGDKGKYVWAKLGFEATPEDMADVQSQFSRWLEYRGIAPSAIPMGSMLEIADGPYGKDFLMNGLRFDWSGRVDLDGPSGAVLRQRLGVSAPKSEARLVAQARSVPDWVPPVQRSSHGSR